MNMESTSSSDLEWDHMLAQAVSYQQEFYELLPDWTIYKKSDVQYLKQNIGYALFGSPLFKETESSKDILNIKVHGTTEDKEICDLVTYGPAARNVIHLIFEKICKHGTSRDDTIKYGVIYIILFRNKGIKVEKKDEIIAIPIFKIHKYNSNDNVTTKNNKNYKDIYTTWYIDVKGRVYKNWEDYLANNNLTKCTMVFPKDGYYQPDPEYKITPNHSVVWLVAKDSSDCSQRAKVYAKINAGVTTVCAFASTGLGIASLFTPVAPVITAGVATGVVSGIWTFRKCTAELYDRNIHEESISPLDKSNLSAWLGIVGCTVGIAASGGAILLKRAAMAGTGVGIFGRTAYNATLIGNISINLIGLGYEGFRIYEKIQTSKNIEIQDVVYFGTHLIFFMNSIVDFKFAENIIKLTQGEVLKDFESNLRNDNLRKRYDYIQRKAATDYAGNETAQNAAVIRYIKKVTANNVSEIFMLNTSYLSNINGIIGYVHGKLKINGITLLDPMLFIADLAKGYINQTREEYKTQENSNFEHHDLNNYNQLMKILNSLLSDLYTSEDCPNKLVSLPDFQFIIKELLRFRSPESILSFIFNIAVKLLRSSKGLEYLVEGCHFVWDYVKANMKEARKTLCSRMEDNCSNMKHMQNILMAFYDAIDASFNRFFNSFHQYLLIVRKQLRS